MAYPYYPAMAAFFPPPPPVEYGRNGSRSSRSRDRSPRRSGRSSRSRDRSRSRSRSRERGGKSSRKLQEENGRTGGGDSAARMLQTIFITGLHPKVDDIELFDLFSQVGRVDDVQLIKDARGKSKGLCYVEFATRELAQKGALMNGQLIGGYPMTITLCTPREGSKSGAGASKGSGADTGLGVRLYVGSLHYNITESDLSPIFEAFGPLSSVEIHRDPHTRISKGFGFVQFERREDGETAMAALDNYDIGGRPIRVAYANPTDNPNGKNPRHLSMGAPAQQQQMMPPMQPAPAAAPYAAPAAAAAPAAPSVPALSAAQLSPSRCMVVSNMFSPAEEAASAGGADWRQEIEEDMAEEAGKHGKLVHIFVDGDDPAGRVFLRFAEEASAGSARTALHGRWFANRQLTAEFMTEGNYMQKFPASEQTQQQQ